ncbi:MAG: acyl-CoA dehydrogenase family protein [Sulfitobacter sp.]
MDMFNHPALEEIDEIAPQLYEFGRRLEKDPEDWADLWTLDLMRALTLIEVPEAYSEIPNCGGRFGPGPVSYLQLLGVSERISRHDPNCILALPTPGLGGFAMSVLGNTEQQEMFFERYRRPRPPRNFFAVTEPTVGSDATHGTSKIEHKNGKLVLTAHKKLVGSMPQSDLGVIFVKDERTKSHRLVIADTDMLSKMEVTRLKTSGLRGADLGELHVTDLPIDETSIVGHGIDRGLRDGFFAMNRVFERYRPMVITMALGVSRGILTDLADCGVARRHLDHAFIRLSALLARVAEIGSALEQGKPKVHDTSRLMVEAITFLDDAMQLAFTHMPTTDLEQHAQLMKRCRDARSFEYMEGTTHIHLVQAFRSYAASA